MVRNFTDDNYEEQLEKTLSNILLNGSDSLKLLFEFFTLLDSPKIESPELQPHYSVGDRTINIINSSSELEIAIKSMKFKPFIGFDSEQKPTFHKNQKSNGICVIQLANDSICHIIQVKQIRNLKPLLELLEDEAIIKIGTGLEGDKKELFNQFNIKLKSTIDFERILKQLSSRDSIGAKRASSIFLNKNLQKSKNMSRSNWENIKLSTGQIKYASEDATVVYDLMIEIIKRYPFVINAVPTFFHDTFKDLR